MRRPTSRYFFGPPPGVWHLILHALTRPRASFAGALSGAARAKEGDGPMKITPWYLAALAPFAAIGYSGAYLGHAAVVLLTLGIFLGTLSLGRTPSTSSSSPPAPPNARAS